MKEEQLKPCGQLAKDLVKGSVQEAMSRRDYGTRPSPKNKIGNSTFCNPLNRYFLEKP